MVGHEERVEMMDTESPIGLGCALDFFSDGEEVSNLIAKLEALSAFSEEEMGSKANAVVLERNLEQWIVIFDRYQEQPHLLDLHLESFLGRLISMIRQTNLPPTLLHQCFKYLYFITKVRGYKTVVRFLPHEVSDLEPVLRMLQTMDRSDSKIWESHYMLLLWLSIIILLPFPMTRLEGISGGVGSGKQSTQERVLSEIKASLIHPVFDFRCSIAAAYLASVFLGRPDTKEACLEGFITWAIDGLRDAAVAQGSKLSLLTALAQLFKHGKRDDLLPYSKVVLETLLKQIDESFGALREKIQLKLLQRVGLTFLQPRVAAWRYQRGSRSLEDNLKTSSSVVNGSASNVFVSQAQASPVQGEDYDIPEEVELIIERLLEGLRNSENIVRWSAAKGIGRITGRLPVELAEDVISSLLDLFSLNELDSAWHGSCLALAELGRRGLLLPKNLSAIIRVLQTALFYDVPQGSFSVGSHVRDAACYLAWSFARAYDPVVLAPFVPELARSLLVMTCFDREINCRRAASAAFQENVGRQGETFAHGIDIVTAADFFAVSNRNNAFLEISRFIAQYPEYRRSLIDHLVERKVNHWDLNIREVTSQALRALTPFDAEYMATTVLAKLMGLASSSSDINAKHGSLIALAEVCKAITEQDPALLSRQPGSVEFLTTFVPRLRSSLVFRQLGADMMRGGTCLFIQRLAESNVGLESIESWLEHIWECLVYIDNNVQLAACCALAQVTSKAPQKVQQRIIDTCIQNLNGNEKQARLGFSQAVTKLPMEFQKTSCFLDPLIFASSIHAGEDAWADVRREGVRALGSLVVASAVSMNQQDIDRVFDVLFTAAQDYTTEKRGDVGAWVREAAMESMIKVVEALEAVGRDSEVISTEVVLQMAGVMAQLSCERIEKTRTLAANSFVKLLYCKVGSRLPNQDQLKSKFHEGMDKEWGMGASTSIYGYFADLLVHPNFQKWVLRGLVQAIGGVTEHLVRRSSDALFTVCKREQNEDLSATFVKHLLDIWEENQRNDRVVIPMLNTLDKILNSSQFAFLSTHPEETEAESPGKRIIELVKQEMSRCNNVAKILSGVNLLCDLLGFADLKVCRRALQHVTLFLCFRYPRVRRASAVRLYESLLVAGDSLAFIPNLDALDQALAILSDTQWGGDMDAVKRARDELCACLDVPTPVLIQKPSTT